MRRQVAERQPNVSRKRGQTGVSVVAVEWHRIGHKGYPHGMHDCYVVLMLDDRLVSGCTELNALWISPWSTSPNILFDMQSLPRFKSYMPDTHHGATVCSH